MFIAVALAGQGASAASPMSAIDWLSETVAEDPQTTPARPEAADTGAGDVTVRPLGTLSPDTAGFAPSSPTGLPATLWRGGETRQITALIAEATTDSLPAITRLRHEVLMAEAAPPAGDGDALLLARIDALIATGALDAARAVLERARPDTPALFRRRFDIALLTGTEAAACDRLRENGGLAPDYPARIFCLALNGDRPAAALTLNAANALHLIGPDEYTLMARFLTPEQDKAGPAPIPALSGTPTPLLFRLHEALGKGFATQTLPRAFAHADLRPVAGWKARLEAAERLARYGAISPERLLAVYSERAPAASGGVWERVAALQRFARASEQGDSGRAAMQLPRLRALMRGAGLEHILAALYAPRLADFADAAPPAARAAAFELALLSAEHAHLAPAFGAMTRPRDRFLQALATGRPLSISPPATPDLQAVRDGFDGDSPALEYRLLLRDDRAGEAILTAARDFTAGLDGDLALISRALRLFRAVGLEDTARRAALQFLISGAQG